MLNIKEHPSILNIKEHPSMLNIKEHPSILNIKEHPSILNIKEHPSILNIKEHPSILNIKEHPSMLNIKEHPSILNIKEHPSILNIKEHPSILNIKEHPSILNIKEHPSILKIKDKVIIDEPFKCSTSSEADITAYIKALDVKKPTTFKNIPARILSENDDIICPYLTKLYHDSKSNCTFSNTLKYAEITPAHKKDDTTKRVIIDQSAYFHPFRRYSKEIYMTKFPRI